MGSGVCVSTDAAKRDREALFMLHNTGKVFREVAFRSHLEPFTGYSGTALYRLDQVSPVLIVDRPSEVIRVGSQVVEPSSGPNVT